MRLSNLLTDVRSTSKPSEKQDIIKSYDCEELRYLLKNTYDPFITFNVKIKPTDIPTTSDKDITEVFSLVEGTLSFCQNSKSPKKNKEMVIKALRELNNESQELLIGTINKKWSAGFSDGTVNRLFPGLINQFNVQLSNTFDYEKHKHQHEWILSYKLDGIRCIALRKGSDGWTLYSRKGKEFLTVDHIKPQLEKLYKHTGLTFFDGELYKHGLTFEEIQGPVMAFSKGQVPDMEYHVFVGGDAEEFMSGNSYKSVIVISNEMLISLPHIRSVTKGIIKADDIEGKVEEAFENGYEGIMLRDPNNLYDYKRSNALLKLKRSLLSDNAEQGEITSDCIVTKIDYNDNFPVIENGSLHTERLLNKIWVQQENGLECKVGSGYSLDFRRKYTESPWELIGSKVEIKHQELGANKRMRFPRLWRVREDL